MSDTKQLEALRDAAKAEKDFQETKHTDAANTLWLAACQTISSCNRAIASLRAAEPVAEVSAHQPSAEQAQQPADDLRWLIEDDGGPVTTYVCIASTGYGLTTTTDVNAALQFRTEAAAQSVVDDPTYVGPSREKWAVRGHIWVDPPTEDASRDRDYTQAQQPAIHPAVESNHARGLFGKFFVSRVDGSGGIGRKHDGCDYFVLDLTHDRHAGPAIAAYADACEAEYPHLARDLRAKPCVPQAQQPARKHCEHCSAEISDTDEFVITADDYWLHRKCAVERPALLNTEECGAMSPHGHPCTEKAGHLAHHSRFSCEGWVTTAQQPTPADVPEMPTCRIASVHHAFDSVCSATDVAALHAACARIARERDEARRELEAEREKAERYRVETLRLDGNAFRERTRADKAEAELAALKAQEPVGQFIVGVVGSDRVSLYDNEARRVMPHGAHVYAAPVPPPDSIPLAQHEAALAQARREERERCARVCQRNAEFFGRGDGMHELHKRERETSEELAAAIRALLDNQEEEK